MMNDEDFKTELTLRVSSRTTVFGLLRENEPLMLDPTDGQEMLGQATAAFRYIDRNFERWNCNVGAFRSFRNRMSRFTIFPAKMTLFGYPR
jgi:hypothetical protein